MSTRPIDSVFEVPERPNTPMGAHQSRTWPITATPTQKKASKSRGQRSSGPMLNCIRSPAPSRSCRPGSSRPNTRLSAVAKVETTEIEIGRLFVEAQQFSEASLSKLEVRSTRFSL